MLTSAHLIQLPHVPGCHGKLMEDGKVTPPVSLGFWGASTAKERHETRHQSPHRVEQESL